MFNLYKTNKLQTLNHILKFCGQYWMQKILMKINLLSFDKQMQSIMKCKNKLT